MAVIDTDISITAITHYRLVTRTTYSLNKVEELAEREEGPVREAIVFSIWRYSTLTMKSTSVNTCTVRSNG